MEFALTGGIFALAMSGLALGVILSNRKLGGSCGGMGKIDEMHFGGEASCGACAKQEAEICPSDDPLVRLAQISHPNPAHHH